MRIGIRDYLFYGLVLALPVCLLFAQCRGEEKETADDSPTVLANAGPGAEAQAKQEKVDSKEREKSGLDPQKDSARILRLDDEIKQLKSDIARLLVLAQDDADNEIPLPDDFIPESMPTPENTDKAVQDDQVRMATWNLRLLRGDDGSDVVAAGSSIPGKEKWKKILDFVQNKGIDIIAFQEVYNGAAEIGHEARTRGYTFELGMAVRAPFRFRGHNYKEHCPIMYNQTKLDCPVGSGGTVDLGRAAGHADRKAHYRKCQVKPVTDPKKFDFVFVCLHLSYKDPHIDADIAAIAAGLPAFRKLDQDVILAGDFNSHPHGRKEDKWTDAFGPPNLLIVEKLPDEAFTKMYERTANPFLGPPEALKLDDLLWFEATKPDYIAGSKKVLYAPHDMFPGVSAANSFKNYYQEISDHLPVIADFRANAAAED